MYISQGCRASRFRKNNLPGHGRENLIYEFCVSCLKNYDYQLLLRHGTALACGWRRQTSDVEGKKPRTVDEGRFRSREREGAG